MCKQWKNGALFVCLAVSIFNLAGGSGAVFAEETREEAAQRIALQTQAMRAKTINDPQVFAYDPATRTAVSDAESLRICHGGELTIGDEKDPAKGETLQLSKRPTLANWIYCNGTLKVYNSTLQGNTRGRIHPMNIGRIIVVNSVVNGFVYYETPMIKAAKPDAKGRITVTEYGSRVEECRGYPACYRQIMDVWGDK